MNVTKNNADQSHFVFIYCRKTVNHGFEHFNARTLEIAMIKEKTSRNPIENINIAVFIKMNSPFFLLKINYNEDVMEKLNFITV